MDSDDSRRNISYMSELTQHLFIINYLMYGVYILKSKKDDSLYIGYTNNVERRLDQHNRGLVKYTKDRKPWKIVYYEAFVSLEDARLREKRLKYFGKAFGQLKRRISNSLHS